MSFARVVAPTGLEAEGKTAFGRAEPGFEVLFGHASELNAIAHGRVNLIGEHTDYNDGFVLPTPIPQRTEVALARRSDDLVRAFSTEFAADPINARADILEYRLGHEVKRDEWIDYVQGVTKVLRAAGIQITGFEVRIASDVPVGGGLSSSAALEVALLRALKGAFELDIEPTELARYGQRVETEFIGAPIGIMDQMSASLGVVGEALFIDTRTLDYERIALPRDVDLVVISSGIAHAHGTGEYRARRKECDEAARALGVEKLRDADLLMIERAKDLPAPLDRRARHVVSENERVLESVRALRRGDSVRLGELFYGSQASMRDDFEISIPEIDLMIDLAASQREVFGARMTGGGFGGSIVVLARKGTGREVGRRIAEAYRAATQQSPQILVD
jgi:galactokinase